MTVRFAACLFAATLVLLSGCGTLANNLGGPIGGNPTFTVPPRIYGGVCHDLEWTKDLFFELPSGKYPVAGKTAQLVAAPFVVAIDMPLSFVFDTISLPMTVRYTLDKDAWNKRWQRATPEGENEAGEPNRPTDTVPTPADSRHASDGSQPP